MIELHTLTLDQLRALAYELLKDRDRIDAQLRTVETVIGLRKNETTPPAE
jgi:hypothetical protein